MKRGYIYLTGLLLVFLLLSNTALCFSAETSALGKGKISGYCFNDENGNGVKDEGEEGVAGVPVSLKRVYLLLFPREIGAAQTSTDGAYEFANLGLGFYRTGVQNISGYECKTKNPVVTFIGLFRNNKVINFGFSENTSTTTIPSTTSTLTSTSTSTAPTTTTSSVLTTSTSSAPITTTSIPTVIPPDPATVAPPLDPTVATDMDTAAAFLYTGDNPIQYGVAPGTIKPKQVAVLRGKVLNKDNSPLSGVIITILAHPEFGITLSREDGRYDMAVNGGGQIAVKYEKTGYLPSQRHVEAPWQDYIELQDTVMIAKDTNVTPVAFMGNNDMQAAQGSIVTDNAGTRQATLLFPQATQAAVVLQDGTTRTVETLNVRATEYSAGENGTKAMPAELPPNSAYTYCVELSADETVAKVNGKDVVFNQPIYFYSENFLNADVGTPVPLGYYDNTKGVWVPSESGRVIKVITITAGMADLDVDGDGATDTGTKLSDLGITDAERTKLATLYQAGQSLWRMPMRHLSTWDANWAFGPPPDGTFPKQKDPTRDKPLKDPCEEEGSIIECQNQVLGQRIPVTGTPFSLNYRSNRVIGRKAAYTLKIPLSGPTVPASLISIELDISVAGRQFSNSLARDHECLHQPPLLGTVSVAPAAALNISATQTTQTDLTNQSYTFTWDGKDVYGRVLQGSQPVTVRIGYTYCGVYQKTDRFGYNGGGMITGSRTRQTITLWQEWKGSIGLWDASTQSLGAWTISANHVYDPVGKVMYLGDGRILSADGLPLVITTVAGDGTYCNPSTAPCGDGGPATQAQIGTPTGVAVAPDGSFYIADIGNSRVRRVGPDGIITTVAGTGVPGYSGDGGPATQAKLNLRHIAVAPDGSFYIGDDSYNIVRRVGTDGIITTVAGGAEGQIGNTGDGGPATQAGLGQVNGVAVGPDGCLYIAAGLNIRRVGPDGIITTVAGSNCDCYWCPSSNCGYSGPATQATIRPISLVVSLDGSLYIGDYDKMGVGRVGTDGILTLVAGGGSYSVGDGGPATQAHIHEPRGLALGPDNSLYIADPGFDTWGLGPLYRVRRVGPDGIITTVAGNGQECDQQTVPCGEWGPATQAKIQPGSVAVAPDGSFYITDAYGPRIRRVGPPLSGYSSTDIFIASEDASEVYVFNSKGRHLKTLDAITGFMRFQFSYDADGHLTQIQDGDGNITTFTRENEGNPTGIVSPYGQQTSLSLDANGYLASITNPASEANQFFYTNKGLMTSFVDPTGSQYLFTYDDLGLLLKDEDPAGGFQTLSRSETSDLYDVTLTNAMNQSTIYRVEDLSTGDLRLVNTLPSELKAESLIKTDGDIKITYPDGSVLEQLLGPDPRFGMQAPLSKSFTITTPGNLKFNVATSSTATLADPSNPLNISAMTDTIMINNRTYTSDYNAGTRMFTDTTPAGRQTTTKIDLLGRVIEHQISGLSPTQFTYDTQGRLAAIAQGSGEDVRNLSFHYNAEGYVDHITDSLSNIYGFEYDAAGRITKDVLPDGRETVYVYDANDNITAITPPGKPTHFFSYNPVNLMAEYTPPDVLPGTDATQYTYNKGRQLTNVLRPDGQAIDYGYDSAGRLSTITHPGGQIISEYSLVTGNPTKITASDGCTLSYTYDGYLLTSETWGGTISGSVSSSYDNNLRVISHSINSDNSVSYQYDTDSLITKAGDLTLAYDSQKALLTGTVLGAVSDVFSYNSFGELSSYIAKYNSTELFKQQLTYNKQGRITQIIETISSLTNTYDYSYDQAGRLINVKKNGTTYASYGYDSNNNRVSYTGTSGTVNGTYDNQDRLTQYGSATYTYTANGELLTKTAAGQTTTYSYDVFGNSTGVALPDGKQINYLVDGYDRRIGKKVNGTLIKGFLYQDLLKPIAELDGSNNVVSQFIYATGINVPEYMIKGGATYRFIKDYLGCPRLIINIANGTIAQSMDYDEFGNVTADTNPGFQPFGFAGGLYDPDTKLIRFGVRDYDAETGRWTAKDPLLFWSGDSNVYEYVRSNPVNANDLIGLKGPHINLFDPSSGHYKGTENYNYPDDLLTIPGHGNQKEVYNRIKENPLTPEQLSKMIDKKLKGRRVKAIWLLTCYGGGKGSFAERLALLRKEPIISPKKKVTWKWDDDYENTRITAPLRKSDWDVIWSQGIPNVTIPLKLK